MSKLNNKRKTAIWQKVEKPIFIFCGGEKTEPNYFNGFKYNIESNAIYRNVVSIDIIKEPSDTIRILNKAIEYIKVNKIKNGEVWCVFDKDDFNSEDFNNAIYKADSLNEQSDSVKYHIAWSNECIEIWFLLHFCYYTQNNGRNNYFKKLNEIFEEKVTVKYEKNNKDIFSILLEHGNPKEAINFAKKLEGINNGKTPADSVPGTKVYKLVESLLIYLPESIKNNFINQS